MAVKKPEEYSATGERLENAEEEAFAAPSAATDAPSNGEEEAAARAQLQRYWAEINRENAAIAAIQKQIDQGWSAIHRNQEEIDAALRRLQAE